MLRSRVFTRSRARARFATNFFERDQMKARNKWKDEASFLAESGAVIPCSGGWPAGSRRQKFGPAPDGNALMGTGGCVAFDVVMILKEPSGYQGLRGGNRGRTRRSGTQSVYAHSFPFYSDRKKTEFRSCGEGNQASAEKILLGFNNAGKRRN